MTVYRFKSSEVQGYLSFVEPLIYVNVCPETQYSTFIIESMPYRARLELRRKIVQICGEPTTSKP